MTTALALAFAPVAASAAPPQPTAQAQPGAAQPPVEGPEEDQEHAKARALHKGGIGLLAGGGVVAATGFGLTLAFTIIGDRRQSVDEPVLEDIEQADALARVGGILLASGTAVVAIGGIVFASSKKKRESGSRARIRVAPALGGLVVSGQF